MESSVLSSQESTIGTVLSLMYNSKMCGSLKEEEHEFHLWGFTIAHAEQGHLLFFTLS